MSPPTRLRARRDIETVLRHGARSARTVAAVRRVDRGDAAPARATVMASRSIGSAVVRNRAKRRLRAALAAAPLPAGVDLVVIARRPAVDSPFVELQRQLHAAVSSAGGGQEPRG